ncbi:ABC transporter ATP-binding protein [[Eubacterium] cellulosolvens]
MEYAVTVKDLWKKFKIPHEKRATILEKVAGVFQILSGKRFTYEEFWALREINFSVRQGESLGIIGENGSGKSTLLKLLANILRPDRGKIIAKGKIAPILELGVGFHPELTIEENTLIYGSILGLKNKEIKKQMDEILQFSGLERFRDAKLKNLSSGMQIRLGFSVAIETNPNIFLIDEALAVGDMEFQQKCINKFKDFKDQDKSIVLVSHDMNLVRQFCEETLFLSKGEAVDFGETDRVIKKYTNRLKEK